ncbi:Protein of unknown function [Pyronema omphalodes CBS 100304]|uniref:Uncharacterized protein n=1 Tax=Pyronema omphalodes (strain CBS 100304) TaxID=1076935 RepID=U4LV32_PYROM|nr:Protein of unknown function [Pyronema omphalodes CBS 100304]
MFWPAIYRARPALRPCPVATLRCSDTICS